MWRRNFEGGSREAGEQRPATQQDAAPPALKLIIVLAFCLAAGAGFWLFSMLAVPTP